MPTDPWRRVETLLVQALERPPENRAEFLSRRCDDEERRAEVASILAAIKEAGGFWDALHDEVAPSLGGWMGTLHEEGDVPTDFLDLEGRRLGPYRLDEEIGAGGMSVVYRAERVAGDFEQTVAVKLLRPLLSAADAADRFRAERQVLASLDHPNIARLIDGGVTEGGRPYLVMEHVNGVPLTEYAERQDLDLEPRLDLLGQVFEAVRAAHRQLVVHRDLKPSNVLVTAVDGEPRVKLLDFGIAKLLDDALPVTRLETRTGQRLMTPAYAAPEQVSGGEVTTTTDVYQLGVLAYELLAGARPFDLTGKSLTEIERTLLEEEPAKPSETAELGGDQLRGDLDTIILKALRKDPERRYRSVETLASDLERYRAGEPVEARPATLGYRARKFVRRNRTAVGAGVLLLLLGVAYAVTVTIQADRLAEQHDRAQREAETAEQVSQFLVDLFEANRPAEALGDTVTAQQLLRRGQDRLHQLEDQPVVQAKMQHVLGEVQMDLGRSEKAQDLFETAVKTRRAHQGPQHPETAISLRKLGSALHGQGEYEEAERYYRKALTILEKATGPEKTEVATTLSNLGMALRDQDEYDAAEQMYRRALSIRRRRGMKDTVEVATLTNNLAELLDHLGRISAADSLYRRTLELDQAVYSAPHPSLAIHRSNLAGLYYERGDYDRAAQLFETVLASERKIYDAPHPRLAKTLNNLGLVNSELGNLSEARSHLRKSLAMRTELSGASDPRTATSHNNLGLVYRDLGEYATAERHFRAAYRTWRETKGQESVATVVGLYNVALALQEQGRYEAAETKYRRVVALDRELLGDDHSEVGVDLSKLADLLREKGDLEEASRTYREASERLPADHPRMGEVLAGQALIAMERRHLGRADSLFRQSLTLLRDTRGGDHWKTARVQSHYGACLTKLGRFSRADTTLRSAYTKLKAIRGQEDAYTRTTAQRLVALYQEWGKPERAVRYRNVIPGRTPR